MTLRHRPGSPYWHADYVDAAGRRVQRCTYETDEAAARRVVRGWLREAARGATVTDVVTAFHDHVAEQVRAGATRPDTASFYSVKLSHAVILLGRLRRLGGRDVRGYVSTRREAGVSDATVAKELRSLRTALRYGVELEIWRGGSPDVARVRGLRDVAKSRETWLTEAQARELVAVLDPPRVAFVAFALATGAELSALRRARRRDLDLRTWEVHLRGTKRETRDRVVPVVLPVCRDLLRLVVANTPAGDGDGALLRPWGNVRRDLAVACTRAGVPAVTPTDLRRTFATWHVLHGASLETLAPMMGHSSTAMLRRHYAKARATELRARLEKELAP